MLLPNEFMSMIQGKVGFKSRARHDFGSFRAVSGAPGPRRPRFAGPQAPLRGHAPGPAAQGAGAPAPHFRPAPFFPGSFSPFGPTPHLLAEARHAAVFAKGLAGGAHRPAVEHQPVAEVVGFLRGQHGPQVFLHLFRGVLAVSPSRPAMRIQCVSVTTAGLPYTSPSTRLAVLRPTPGSFSRSSMLSGTLPPNSSLIIGRRPECPWPWPARTRRSG